VTQHPGFPIKSDVFDFRQADSRFIEAILDSAIRETAMVLDAGKALFLDCRYQFPIAHDGCCCIAKSG